MGWGRSRAWICDFSSTQNTRARSGGSRHRPTTSWTLSTKYGSVDNLKVCDRCGCRPNARQIRDTDDCDRPISFAIDRVDQCVAFFGVDPESW